MNNTRPLGLMIAGIGTVAVIVGLIGWVSSGGDSTPASEPLTPTTSTVLPTTTTSPATTTTTPTTTAAETTTTTIATTTTPGRDEVAAFVGLFSAALDAGDQAFVASRLHPDVIDGYGADLCTAWISNEIMTLTSYRLIGGLDGPLDQVFTTPGGNRSISNAWTGRVAFTFQGTEFEGDAGFAIVDGVVHWLGQCR